MTRPMVPADPAPVLVTGGTHGIGAACVRLLAGDGWPVLFCGRDAEAGAALAAATPGARYFEADLGGAEGIADAAAAALDLSGGRLAGLVNNAGVGVRAVFAETDDALYDRVMDLNLRAPVMLTARLMPALAAEGGSVVMISSVAGKAGEKGLALYTASKAALIGLAKSLALEVGPAVRVNAVCPGQIETRMMGRTLSLPGRRDLLTARIPAGRLGLAEDVAEAVCWLVSPRSAYVSGDVITVDGGETAGLMVSED
ncbi:MAG: SDR family oxidoreductase [Pseudomonadota bacterium]|nr:SDR family oxidoreductase [Pseudomonadota bacterium]MEE3101277.1 SDR family oxidoreductase [Pseudomonadota bacterium]